GDDPVRRLRSPIGGNVAPNVAAESIEIEFGRDIAFAQPAEIEGERLQVEPAGQTKTGEGEMIFLPACAGMQLRECLPNERGRDRDLVRAEAAGLEFAERERAAANERDHGLVLNPQVEFVDLRAAREKSLPTRPDPLGKIFAAGIAMNLQV